MSDSLPIPSSLNGLNSSNLSSVQSSGGSGDNNEAKQAEMEARKQMLINQLLTPEAAERLARIAIVKPDKANEVGSMLLSMAQRGQLTEKIGEERLIGMLNGISEGEKKKSTTISFQRKKYSGDDSDEEYDL
jgi:programmed cell death protein 5